MTVASTVKKVNGNGNGAATVFSFSPMVLPDDSSQLEVTHVVISTGVETVLTEGVGADKYAVTVSEFPGTGSVTYPQDEVTPMTADEKIVMRRVLDQTQGVDLGAQLAYDPEVVERQFDRVVMLVLQLQEELDRSVKVTISSETDPDDLVTSIIESEANAAASADAAATSETNAAASEAAAAISEANAADSAASIELPDPATADTYLRRNAGNTAYEAKTPAEVRSDIGAPALDAAQSFTKGQRGAVAALTDGANIALDLSLSNNFSVTLAGNRTLDNPTNAVAGQSGVIAVTQDATGSRTLAYGTNYTFAGGVEPALTLTAAAVDLLFYYVVSATSIFISHARDIR